MSAVGLVLNDDGAGGVLYDKWPVTGEVLTNTDVLIKYTKLGDADLNGVVDNSTDYLLWVDGYVNQDLPRTWMYGDFDYDGKVNTYLITYFGRSVLRAYHRQKTMALAPFPS